MSGISDTGRRGVTNAVSAAAGAVIRWTTNTINKGYAEVNGQILYEKLFGAKPYKVAVVLSEEMKLIMSRPGEPTTLKATGVRFEGDMTHVTVPILFDTDYGKEVWITMPLSKPMPYLAKYTTKEWGYGETKKKGGITEFDHRAMGETAPALALQVQGVMHENYFPDFVDGVMRGAQLVVRIGTLEERIRRYMNEGVKSLGALYLNIPSLSAIHTPTEVKHVRYMRQGTKADPKLIEDVNLLATLRAAMKAAGGVNG